MESLRTAATLLSAANNISGIAPILTELGFESYPQPLDQTTSESLGIPDEIIKTTSVALGPGALRALVVFDPTSLEASDMLTRIGTKISARAPHLLWLIIMVRKTTGETALAVCERTQKRIKVIALLSDRDSIIDSDAETLCAMCSAKSDNDLLTYTRWIELLGRTSITRRFYRTLERLINDMARNDETRKELALLHVSRLLFLSFLETKGWLNNDFGFLANSYADCMGAMGNYQRTVLEPLFFGTLNTRAYKRAHRAHAFGRIPFLNGGLFARTPLEKRNRDVQFSDEEMGNLFGDLLTRYRFTAREDSSAWAEAAIDPEMLGKAFESLMEANTRKKSGAFYTPHPLVEQVSEYALSNALNTDVNQIPVSYDEKVRLLDATARIRVLDPACGSGAFLVHVLEKLADLRCKLLNHGTRIHMIRREVLMNSVFGVDVNPTAVWLCELRLWLSVVMSNPERDPMRVLPLPNLDRHIRIGDSLAGGDFEKIITPARQSIVLARNRYTRATGTRKKTLARVLEREERRLAIAEMDRKLKLLLNQRKDVICPMRSHDLFGDRKNPPAVLRNYLKDLSKQAREAKRARENLKNGSALPFFYSAHFADAHAAGGFDVIVGNPPWVRLHNMTASDRIAFKREFEVFRNSAWTEGASQARAGKGFAAQVDMSALFVERSLNLMRDGGVMSLLLPSKLWHSLAGGGVRTLLQDRAKVLALHKLHDIVDEPGSGGNNGFGAAVYPSILVAQRITHNENDIDGLIDSTGFQIQPDKLPLNVSRGSPWLIVPPDVRDAFDAVTHAGIPFSRCSAGRPAGGIKTGCNEAFVVEVTDVDGEIAYVESGSVCGEVERDMLRPLLRGESVKEWRASQLTDYIVWTHDARGKPISKLPLNTHKWLAHWRHQLTSRSDMNGSGGAGKHWWSLFRIESATTTHARVVWSDIGKKPRALVLPVGDRTVPLNTCYVAQCTDPTDAYALAALLNSGLSAAWLGVIAEPARGGYKRYIGWTMALFPIPKRWIEMRGELARLGKRGYEGDPPTENELLNAVLHAYELTHECVASLLQWNS